MQFCKGPPAQSRRGRYIPGMVGVANFVETGNKIFEAVLLERNTHVELVVLGSRTVEFPTTGDLSPGVLDIELVPSLGEERFRDGKLEQTQEEERRGQHDEGVVRQRRPCSIPIMFPRYL